MDSKIPTPTIPRGEAALREELAAYFLSVPPGNTAGAEYRARLRQLGTLENTCALSAAGLWKPAIWGDPVPLLQAVCTAAQRLAATVGQPLLLFPASGISIRFFTRMHPHLLTLTAVNLLRLACAAAPREPVWVRLGEQAAGLTVTVTAAAPLPRDADILAILKESARWHGGRLTLSDDRIIFSCGRADPPEGEVPPFTAPTADALVRDTLSPVWSGFYAWLAPPAVGGSGNASAVPELTASDHAKQSASTPTAKSATSDTPLAAKDSASSNK